MLSTTEFPQLQRSHFSSDSSDDNHQHDAPLDLSQYRKQMHRHTKMQMEAASRSARRRVAQDSAAGAGAAADHQGPSSSSHRDGGSVSSMDSGRSLLTATSSRRDL